MVVFSENKSSISKKSESFSIVEGFWYFKRWVLVCYPCNWPHLENFVCDSTCVHEIVEFFKLLTWDSNIIKSMCGKLATICLFVKCLQSLELRSFACCFSLYFIAQATPGQFLLYDFSTEPDVWWNIMQRKYSLLYTFKQFTV